MPRATNIRLWDRFPMGHWLRSFGTTEIIIIDDEIHAEEPLLIPPDIIEALMQRLNIEFYYFSKDPKDKWDVSWFEAEFSKMKKACKNPSIIFLDLMFGRKQKTPYAGSGITFLEIIRSDPSFADVPIIIHTAGQQNDPLVQRLKDRGSCQGFLEKGYNADRLGAIILEFALLSDPNIHAYSKAMRMVAQNLRKLVLDAKLKETIENEATQILPTTLLIGHSGDGKNFLAKYLISISPRKDQPEGEMDFSVIHDKNEAVIRMFGQLPFTDHVGHYFRLNIESGKIDGDPIINKPKTLDKNHLLLAQIGLATYLDGGTIILNELGNSPKELQQTLLTFLDKRTIQPRHYSGFLPTKRSYDLWIIVTMQPQHSFIDLGTRMDYMQKIIIPSLKQRAEDIVPLAAYTLDKQLTKEPEELFRPEALTWLKDKASALSVRTFTGLIRNVQSESSIGHFNVSELERAYSKLRDLSSPEEVLTTAQDATLLLANTEDFITEQPYRQDIEFPIQHYRIEMVKSLILELEKEKHRISGEPEYPATLYALTGEKTSSRKDKAKGELTPLQGHRKLCDIIFSVPDEDIVRLIQETKSRVFIQAVIQLGRKIAKERLRNIMKAEGLKADSDLVEVIKEVTDKVNKRTAPYQNRAPRKK